jgi:carbonic anhydrase
MPPTHSRPFSLSRSLALSTCAVAVAALTWAPGLAQQRSGAVECPPPDNGERRERLALSEMIRRGTTMEEIAERAERRATSPDGALCELKYGNTRFFTGEVQDPMVNPLQRRALALGQSPYATVLGCSDSRVPAEQIFDQGPGDLFVVRNAGNVAGPHAVGSIEYAVRHLNTNLVVVMGHEGCGAVEATMLSPDERKKEPANIQQVLRDIEPALKDLPHVHDRRARDRMAVVANVRHQVRQLQQNPVIREAEQRGELRVVGAYYSMASGGVEFLDPEDTTRRK